MLGRLIGVDNNQIVFFDGQMQRQELPATPGAMMQAVAAVASGRHLPLCSFTISNGLVINVDLKSQTT